MTAAGRPPADRYAEAGVSLERADRAKAGLRRIVTATFNDAVLGAFGGFGGAFDLAAAAAEGETVLVASADGVGTKLEVVQRSGCHETIGEDLVNHCVNDVLAQGARPLFFLDYLGCARLEPARVAEIVAGVARACSANRCVLLGGETAEMPGLYRGEDYDLAGFLVGVARREGLVDGSEIRPGDLVLGLRSSGLHTNGYSLARRIVFQERGLEPRDPLPGTGQSVADALLAVHRSYLRAVTPLLAAGLVRGMVHVTGGGFVGNVRRVLPPGVGCEIDARAWTVPPLFRWLREAGSVDPDEMYRVFNMGIGFLLFVRPADAERARSLLGAAGETDTAVVGRAVEGSGVTVEGAASAT